MKRVTLLVLATIIFACSFASQPKYIFYMIGDGMGMNHIALTEMYLAEIDGYIGRKPLCMTQFPYTGMCTTFSESNAITCSSAAGTALATGVKTKNGRVGMTSDNKHPETIAEHLHSKGWNVGLLTSVSIDHATPAAFYASSIERGDYYTIGTQLAATQFEFFGGGTFYKPYVQDKPEEPNVYDLCDQNGYTFFHGYDDFVSNNGAEMEKVILIQKHEGLDNHYLGEGRLPYAIDRQKGDMTLEEITRAAIAFMTKKEKPFFLMIEGGQIDWASHNDDAATVIRETEDFDQSIRQAYEFYRQHPDETLIVVTADHETGGLALGNHRYTLNLQLLQNQKASAPMISDMLKELKDQYGKKLTYEHVKALFSETLGLYSVVEVKPEEDTALRNTFKKMMHNKATDTKTLYDSLNAMSDQAVRLLDKKAHVGWTSHTHTGAPVPVFAIGAGAELFTGVHDNTDLTPLILKIAGE